MRSTRPGNVGKVAQVLAVAWSLAGCDEARVAPARLPIAELREADFAAEDCTDPSRSALARAVLAHGPSFVRDAEFDWGGPPRCQIIVPHAVRDLPVRGATLTDVDGDGRAEALAMVEFRRARPPTPGGLGEERETGAWVFRATARGPVVALHLHPQESIDGAGASFDVVGEVRREGRLVRVRGESGCHDCGCDYLELAFDCRADPCRFAAERLLEEAPSCDSP